MRAFPNDNFDDVETKKNVRIIQEPQPGKATACNSLLLIGIDGVKRPSEVFACPRFHFDEDKRVFVAADDVDLAAGSAAKITIEDLIAVPPQKPARQLLPAIAKSKMFGSRR